MEALQRVTDALNLHGCRGRGSAYQCPAHDDRHESLSVNNGDGKVKLMCHATCSTEDVLAALGLVMADLFDEPLERQEPETRYSYTDEHGKLLFTKVRFPGKKFFVQNADGSWGIGAARRVLYNLPVLIKGIENGERVYIAEGEKDCDRLWRAGVVATTNFDGAGKWRDEYSDYFKGASVTIVADRDEPGVAHAMTIASSLKGKANSVRIVQSKTEGKGDDVSDHLAKYELNELVPLRAESEISRRYKPVDWTEAFRCRSTEVNWLFPPILEAGTLNVLFGLPGVGKSLLVLDLVLEIMREGRKVLVLDEENRVNEVVERLEKFGVSKPDELENLTWFSFPQLPPLDTPEGGEHLVALADVYEPDLIIMDTTTRMIEGDENSANTWLQLYRNSLAPVKQRGIAALRLDHQGKDPTKGQRGSSAKDGDVDTIWRLKFTDDGMFALEREKSRSGHGEDWLLIRRLEDPLRHVFEELDHMPITPKIKIWADRFDRWDIPRSAGRPTLRAALQEKTTSDEGISTTLLAMVARYRKSLDAGQGWSPGNALDADGPF